MPITPQDAFIGGSADATVWLNSNVTVNSISTTAGSTLTSASTSSTFRRRLPLAQ